jgi:hypothetical protein
MNWPEIESRWEPMRALLASYWPELSEGDLTRIDGKRDMLTRVLRERHGLDASAAEAAVCAFEKDVRRPGAVK